MYKKNDKPQLRGSIKLSILGSVVPIVVVMMLVIVFISYKTSSSNLMGASSALLDASLKSQKYQVEAWLDEKLQSFEVVKRMIETGNMTDEELEVLFNEYFNYNSDYLDGYYIGDSEGYVIKATDAHPIQGNVTDTQWYREGLTRVSMAYGKPYINDKGEAVVSASGILKDPLGRLRVLAVDVRLQSMSVIVNSNVEMEKAETFLVDTNSSTILSHRDSDLISANINTLTDDAFLTQVAEYIEQGSTDSIVIDGKITQFEKIDGTDWLLVSYIPEYIILSNIEQFRNTLTTVSVIALIILIILVERLIHFTILPIKRLTDVITEMTAGDFNVEVEVKGNNEISIMSASVKSFAEYMREMVTRIKDISVELKEEADTSKGISSTMYNVSKEQTNSMLNLNITVEELVKSVTELANDATTLAMVVANTKENSDQVKDKMTNTVVASAKGKEDMDSINVAMNDISKAIEQLSVAINRVGTVSGEITQIANLIGGIAKETQLLSLNASIEAARAGESGKGFAVVASEIGKLANTSKDAVEDISKLVTDINSLVTDAIVQAKDSVSNINTSGELIHGAVGTFDTIYTTIQQTETLIFEMIDKVNKVDEVAAAVAAISEEQAASAELILATSENMVTQAQTITENSEEVDKGAEQLLETSNELTNQMSVFKI